MASTDQSINRAEKPTAFSAPSIVDPLKPLTQAEIDMAIIGITIEAAWTNCEARLKKAKTAAERRDIRYSEMHTVNTASEAANTREAQEILDARIRLLGLGMELGVWEEKYWFSRGGKSS